MKKIFEENGLLSGKRVLAATLVMVLLSSMTFFSAAAGHTWKSQGNVEAIKSDGSKTVVFDKSDLDYLDGRIDAIEADVSTGKENLANALNPLGTNPSLGTPLSGTSTFNELMEAINHSQAIPDKTIGESVSIATEDYELASKVTGQTINSDTKISAATADNLSLGTSAWVDGSLLIGTGADNKNYYELGISKQYRIIGYSQGYAGTIGCLAIDLGNNATFSKLSCRYNNGRNYCTFKVYATNTLQECSSEDGYVEPTNNNITADNLIYEGEKPSSYYVSQNIQDVDISGYRYIFLGSPDAYQDRFGVYDIVIE